MHIGNRIFPYPVLNNNESLSGYVTSSTFKVEFDASENGAPYIENDKITFKNLRYSLTDPYLSNLLQENKLKGAFIVESSSCMFRTKFDITEQPRDLQIIDSELNGNVEVSCYLYATEEIPRFKSDDFISDYAEYSFDIDKFDILAVDDGYHFKIDRDPIEDDKVSSIFNIIKTEENSKIVTYDNDDKYIKIYLPVDYYGSYDNIKTRSDCNNIAFAILAIPALAFCLNDICFGDQEYLSIDEVLDDHSWFSAVLKSYKKEIGKDLTYEEFESINKFELAQMVLNNATCNGLKDFDNMLLGDIGDQEDNDE